jgi:acyl-CoA reductase-like NAD-dependent aldehyde dehydrogenase
MRKGADVLERGLLIGGKSVPASSGKLADDICPWDGEVYARVAAGTPADITRAADAAQAAFPGWSAMGAFERREIFLRAADVMAGRGEEAITALARETGASRVSALVHDAAAKGATLLTGDGAIGGPNRTLIRPVVLTDVRPGMDIFASEIFGPATVIHPVDSAQAAIDLANDTEYGLTGGVISRDLSAALDVVSRVRSGIIHINDQGIADEPMAPFGGVRNSGYGKFGGTAGIASFTEQRWVTIQHTGRPTYSF